MKAEFNRPLKTMLVISFESYFSALSSLAQEGQRTGALDPLLYFPSSYPWIERERERCKSAGLLFYHSKQSELLTTPNPSFIQRVLRKAMRFWDQSFGGAYFGIRKKRRLFRRLLEQVKPEILVFGGDITGHEMAILMAAAHDLDTKCVIVPSWMAGPEEPAANISRAKEYWARGMNSIFAKAFPNWLYQFQGMSLVKLPWQQALALELNRLAPPQPWILHSGFADEILLESQFMLDYGARVGLPMDKMKVLGSPAHDRLHSLSRSCVQQKERVCTELGLDSALPILLMALPPDFVASRRQSGLENYKEVIDAFLLPAKALAGHQYSILLSLHPSCTAENFLHLETPSIKVFRGNILDAIPICDLFVASISSTIQWAAGCGKPVLNYDLYHFHYSDYTHHAGILFVDNAESYRQALGALLQGRELLKTVGQSQQDAASYFGRMDGQAVSRLCSRLRHLARG